MTAPKPAPRRRRVRLTLRVTMAFKRALKAKAKSLGISPSRYLIRLARADGVEDRPTST